MRSKIIMYDEHNNISTRRGTAKRKNKDEENDLN